MKSVIIGNSGSGKTWLAHAMSGLVAAPVVHLDDIFWEPGGFDRRRGADEVSALIVQAKERDCWIVEGVFGELAQRFLSDAKQLIWLDLEWSTCRDHLVTRGSESKKHLDREQSQEGLRRLVEWAGNYRSRSDMRSYQGHKTMFDAFDGVRIRLQSEHEVADFVRDIQHSTAVGRACAPLS
jgi:adenylate kinase family enzyme